MGFLAVTLMGVGWACGWVWSPGIPIALVYLPAGISIAVLSRWGVRLWPAIPIAFAINGAIAGRPPTLVAATVVANTVIALLGVRLLNRRGPPALERLSGIASLLAAAVVAPLPAALIATIGLRSVPGLPPSSAFLLFAEWYGGDVVGILLAVPPVLLWSGIPSWGRMLRQRWAPIYLAAILLLLGSLYAVSGTAMRGGVSYFTVVLLATGTAALALPLEVVFAGAFVASVGSLASYAAAAGPGSYGGLVAFFALATNTAIVAVATLVIGAVSSERREREDALARSEERYRRLVHSVPVGILLHDPERVVYANPEAQRVLLAPPETSLVGRPVRGLFSALPRGLSGDGIPVLRAPDGIAIPSRVQLLRSDGRAVETECTVEALPEDEEGRRVTLVAFRDVSDRAALEKERSRFAVRTKQAERLESLGLLAGGIAHDFNNLLTAILGNVALVRVDLREGDSAWGAVDTIEMAGRRAAELTGQLLAFSGRHDHTPEPVALKPEVEEVFTILRLQLPPGVECRLEAEPGLPPVQADPPQLRTVLRNLAKNAAEAIGRGPGGITVRLRAVMATEAEMACPYFEEAPPAGRYVRIEVVDTGSGMSREAASRIFDPFFSTKRPGRGLGLASALGIVKAHGGTVQVESEAGKGTTVRLFLPPATEKAVPRVRRTPTDVLKWLPIKGGVLVVDRDDLVVETICRTLRRIGLEPSSASSAAEARTLLARSEGHVRLAFVEMALLDDSGRRLSACLLDEKPDLPVVLLSEKERMPPAMPAGPMSRGAALLKPFNASDVRESLLLALTGAAVPAESKHGPA
jgi:PAS domain S-box-containing protein